MQNNLIGDIISIVSSGRHSHAMNYKRIYLSYIFKLTYVYTLMLK